MSISCRSGSLFQRVLHSVRTPRRHLNLLEFQSKGLLEEHQVKVQKFLVAASDAEAVTIPKKFPCEEYVIKAQILAGGRGKGTFDNGFKGGVHLTKDKRQVASLCSSMLGHKLITKQTPPKGIPVSKVMVAEAIDIKR
ncbi:Succinate--CoA ligase subunit beta_ mitochondrial [Caligus rogercresseyi]|uniref:Succinate--CoA ligase subunit beta_ mitochondrial n=1 Tax=Caligus rogercresseyi TaxID=217165 RepID=A0A7T8KHI9_CALRO|nr:Succinate--CoA ligase subunit beta_ mitochondrial [Caligus rogercresseyi]